jgi:hypothetical protein
MLKVGGGGEEREEEGNKGKDKNQKSKKAIARSDARTRRERAQGLEI